MITIAWCAVAQAVQVAVHVKPVDYKKLCMNYRCRLVLDPETYGYRSNDLSEYSLLAASLHA